ncbi:hypothetical protein HMSSN139_22680 [Paenibacillus sp. HMSSN-139]|nr:hypothetical protein HMSSN139_22680 [Paenibacillus sp. HMSSN-139]
MNHSHATTDMRQGPSMFCFQCQEAAGGTGCTIAGVCGKPEEVANLQDLLIYLLKGASFLALDSELPEPIERQLSVFTMNSLFATITNANFDRDFFVSQIRTALALRNAVRCCWNERHPGEAAALPDAARWEADEEILFAEKRSRWASSPPPTKTFAPCVSC